MWQLPAAPALKCGKNLHRDTGMFLEAQQVRDHSFLPFARREAELALGSQCLLPRGSHSILAVNPKAGVLNTYLLNE